MLRLFGRIYGAIRLFIQIMKPYIPYQSLLVSTIVLNDTFSIYHESFTYQNLPIFILYSSVTKCLILELSSKIQFLMHATYIYSMLLLNV